MMKKVYICAPLGGNVEKNIQKAKVYTEFALKSGVAPITPHFFALCLDDTKKKERDLGITAGISLLWDCDEMWIFGNYITEGMKTEISFCENFKKKMRKINPQDIKKVLGGRKK